MVALPDQIRVLQRGWLSANNIVFHEGTQATLIDSGYVAHVDETRALPAIISPASPSFVTYRGIFSPGASRRRRPDHRRVAESGRAG